MITRSARDLAPIFLMTLLRWILAVTSLVPNVWATCLFRSPSVTQSHDLLFSAGQSQISGADVLDVLIIVSSLSINLEGPRHGVEQVLITKRLCQKVDGSRLHGSHRHRDIGMSRDEDHGNRKASIGEFGLEIQTAQPRQPNVQYQAARNRWQIGSQQFRRGFKQLDVLTEAYLTEAQRLIRTGSFGRKIILGPVLHRYRDDNLYALSEGHGFRVAQFCTIDPHLRDRHCSSTKSTGDRI